MRIQDMLHAGLFAAGLAGAFFGKSIEAVVATRMSDQGQADASEFLRQIRGVEEPMRRAEIIVNLGSEDVKQLEEKLHADEWQLRAQQRQAAQVREGRIV